MAVIKEYEQQFGVKEFSGGRRAGGEDFGFAQGISDLARGINAGADAMQRYEAQRQLSDAQVKVTEADGVMDESLRGMQESAQPGVSTALQAKAMMTDYFKKMQDNYTSPAAKQYIALHGAKMTNTAVNRMSALDLDLNVKDKFAKQDAIFKNVRDKVFANPAAFNEAIEPVLNEIENSVGVWDVPGGERTKIAMRARVEKELESIAWSAGIGAIQNPTMRKELVNIGRSAVTATADAGTIANAIYGQESSSGRADTTRVNPQNVTGPMQVKQETFEGMKKIGVIPQDYDWKNPEQNKDAGFRWVAHLSKKYDGDAAKVAAAYYAGEKAVNSDGSINRDWKNKTRPNDPTVGEYVDSVVGRIEGMGGVVEDNASAISEIKDMPPWFDKLSPTKKVELFTRARNMEKQARTVADQATNKLIDDARVYMSVHGTVPDTLPNSASVQDPVQREKIDALNEASMHIKGFIDKPVQYQQQMLEAMKPEVKPGEQPGMFSYRTRVYSEMVNILKDASKSRENDYVAFAMTSGYSPDNPIKPIEDYSADKIVEALNIRTPVTRAAKDQYGMREHKPLMENEVVNLRNTINTLQGQDRSDYISALGKGMSKDDYGDLMKQAFSSQPEMFAAGMMMRKGGTQKQNGVSATTIADRMLLGNARMNPNIADKETKQALTAKMPKLDQALPIAQAYWAGIDMPAEDKARLTEAALAYYVGAAAVQGAETDLTLGGKKAPAGNIKSFQDALDTVYGKPTQVGLSKVFKPFAMAETEFLDTVKKQVAAKVPTAGGGYSLIHGTKEGSYIVVKAKMALGEININDPLPVTPKKPYVRGSETASPPDEGPDTSFMGFATGKWGVSGSGENIYANAGVSVPSVSYGDVTK